MAEYAHSGAAWIDVQRALLDGVLFVVVKAVNQRTGAAALDYAKHREHGLRVIAIGGNSLSRGLTLSGLSTSYFYRNSQMYDTLLQMRRWSGYRAAEVEHAVSSAVTCADELVRCVFQTDQIQADLSPDGTGGWNEEV